ncbi:hypothetical protein ACFLV3_03955 [Chloroflexota bacterium]
MEDKSSAPTDAEKLQGVNSLLATGEVECDKCGKITRYLERYCCNTHECPVCGAILDTVMELDSHFSQEHPHEQSRGARYCVDCGLKAGYLKMIRNKKTGEVFPAMFALRDEEEVQ